MAGSQATLRPPEQRLPVGANRVILASVPIEFQERRVLEQKHRHSRRQLWGQREFAGLNGDTILSNRDFTRCS